MFRLVTQDGAVYTGRVGDGWITADRSRAFTYRSEAEASRRAAFLSAYRSIHGQSFAVEPVLEARDAVR